MGFDRAQLLALTATLPPANFPCTKDADFPSQPYLAYTQDPGPAPQDNEVEQGSGDDMSNDNTPDNEMPTSQTLGGRRSRNSAAISDDWTLQRKAKHNEVERRRRKNINEGIEELGRIIPDGSGGKAKGDILSRAAQYMLHLKENEARNIEKWTLERLIIDHARGDIKAQLEEMRRLWEEERTNRMRLEQELETARKGVKRSDDEAKDENSSKRQRSE